MKILELTRAFYPSVGGLEKFVSDRLKIYSDLGIEYTLITTDFSSKKIDASIIKEIPVILNQYTPYNITPGLKKYLEGDYDVLSVNLLGRYYSDYSILYVKKMNKKIILTPHFTFHTENFKLIKRIHKHLLAPKLLNAVDKIICFTAFEKKYWIDNFNIAEKKIEIIPHYINETNVFKADLAPIPENFFLYLGRFDKNKRVDILIEAFTQIKDSDLNLYLTIEEGDLNNYLKKIIQQDSRIKLIGQVTEKQKSEYLSSCEALIFPSAFEAFGTVLLEASIFLNRFFAVQSLSSKKFLLLKEQYFSKIILLRLKNQY